MKHLLPSVRAISNLPEDVFDVMGTQGVRHDGTKIIGGCGLCPAVEATGLSWNETYTYKWQVTLCPLFENFSIHVTCEVELCESRIVLFKVDKGSYGTKCPPEEISEKLKELLCAVKLDAHEKLKEFIKDLTDGL